MPSQHRQRWTNIAPNLDHHLPDKWSWNITVGRVMEVGECNLILTLARRPKRWPSIGQACIMHVSVSGWVRMGKFPRIQRGGIVRRVIRHRMTAGYYPPPRPLDGSTPGTTHLTRLSLRRATRQTVVSEVFTHTCQRHALGIIEQILEVYFQHSIIFYCSD